MITTTTNGKDYSTFMTDHVPWFEANQVLKNTDLNDLVTYLDSHNRLTRTHLIGMGIVCGLEVHSIYKEGQAEIRISKGCGLTSEGYIILTFHGIFGGEYKLGNNVR